MDFFQKELARVWENREQADLLLELMQSNFQLTIDKINDYWDRWLGKMEPERFEQHTKRGHRDATLQPSQVTKMATKLLIRLISVIGILVVLGGLDRFLFSQRISAADPKALYSDMKSIIAQVQMQSVGTDATGTALTTRFGPYRVVLATDHLVILYTTSLTSSAYLAFQRIGNSSAWVVGWLRGAQFSQIGTFRF